MNSKKDFNFVDISTINPRIVLDIRYATENNFIGRVLYSEAKCFLRRPVAIKIDAVQKHLEKQGLGLKIFDGYRPLSVQRVFWDFLADERYIANPEKGSKHNRGAAVDVTLVDRHGFELSMPTGFDDLSERAHRDYQELSGEALQNRDFLEKVMKAHHFIPLPTEWWHFDDAEWELYPIEDIPIHLVDK